MAKAEREVSESGAKPAKKRRVTLADISARTGLSQSAISMILSRREGVSFSETAVRSVRETARELGYAYGSRKSLAMFGRGVVMVVCPYVLNYYYSTIVQAVQSAAAEMSCDVLVYTTYNDSAEEAKILRVLAESDIGGIIFAVMPQSTGLAQKIAKTVPVAVLADARGTSPCEIVELHNYRAGELVAEHLAALGHKKIACFSTPLSSSVQARPIRYEGLRDAWNRLCPDGSLRVYVNYLSPGMSRDNIQLERMLGEEIASDALEDAGDDFTAIVCVNDMIAYGVLDALERRGKRVPEDYSVCGMDNDFPSGLRGVSLTSVEHFMTQNAKLAFRALYRKMSGEPGPFGSPKIIMPELIVRDSSGAPRA